MFFRKAFFETWDTLVFSLLFNFALTVLMVLGLLISAHVPSPVLSVCVVALFFVLDGVILTALSGVYGTISDYRGAGFKDFLSNLKASWKTGVCFFTLLAAMVVVLSVSLPFYFGLKTLYGYVLGGILFWSGCAVLMSLQWFLPVYYRLDKDIKTCLKKSFILFLDNPGFSVFLFIYSVFLIAVSFFLGFLAPGWTSVLIAGQGALRLRMFKYDWLEEQEKERGGKAPRAKIPWKEILADESENVGHRTLKTFFMPWKE